MPSLTFLLWGGLFDHGPVMGLVLNLTLTVLGLVAGALLGVPLGVFRAVAPPSLQLPVALVLGVIRGTPLLLLVLWSFLLIQVVGAVPMAPLWIGAIALGLYALTHISDIVRAGCKAVSREQLRAAHSLGLSHLQIIRSVLLPISLRVMIPALTTFAASVFKDSSVCFVIGVIDLMQLTMLETARRPEFLLEYYALMAFLFLVITLIGTRLAARLESRWRIRANLS